jgi:hypothetical protein
MCALLAGIAGMCLYGHPLYMCRHTAISGVYVSFFCYVCPHTAMYMYMSSYCCICVVMLLYLCPHAAICVLNTDV